MSHKFTHMLSALSLAILAGCSADEPLSIPGADGKTTLNLLIPSAEMAHASSRAENNPHGDRLATEGKINTLAVAGFYTDNGERKHFFAELDEEMSTGVENVYRSYKLSVIPAEYTLYVFANIPLTASIKEDLEKTAPVAGLEDEIKAMTFPYASLPTAGDGLPMAATQSADVKQDQEKQLVVNLGYLCAKARLTVIYNNAFGSSNPFKIDGMDVKNAYTPSKIFLSASETHGTGADKTDFLSAGSPTHYELSEPDAERDLAYWTNMPDDPATDPLDRFSNVLTGNAGWTRFAWQNTVYIPECVGKEDKTALDLKAGTLKAKVNIGCDSSSGTHSSNTSGNVERGHFYDIVAMVADDGEITYKWNVSPWSVENIAVQLAGRTELTLARTNITETLSGDEPAEIAYTTTAPRLTFESDKDDATGLPIFLVAENRSSNTLTVNVNSEIGIHSDLIKEKGFWVIAGNIRKRVTVETVNLQAFLRILPATQSVSIRNIANEPKYSIYYDYATNADELALNLTSFSNSNTSKGYSASGGEKGIYVEICTMDSVAVSEKIPLTSGINLLNPSKLLSADTPYPKNGLIRLTIADPTQAAYFSKQIKGTFTASVSAAGLDPKKADFSIEPNPTVYTIYFKPINADKWVAPHIYVYQPLSYQGYPVYGSSGSDKINWIEYSFTGNMAFCGWMSEGGSVTDASTLYSLTTVTDKAGSSFDAYDVGGDWGDPGKPEGYSGNSRYAKDLNLLGSFSTGCSTCQSSRELLWPGIGMVKEPAGSENEGWWKIELPLLAKPGSAMVMFVCGHGISDNGDSNDNGDDNYSYRYPKGSYPGIPLPNYSDREAWFLYDLEYGAENCAFSDDRRDSYIYSEGERDDDQIGICWYVSEPNTASSICLTQSGKELWPDQKTSDWTRQEATKIGTTYYFIQVDRSVFNSMDGYSWGYEKDAKWSDNKHSKFSEIPSEFSSYGLKELYRIWK
ncbi:MAG: hypothetical protein K2H76_10060 [Muribaculaceae bacterium]|nr:hypothetical protein [Muribaculaceae bacterium]